MGLGGGGEVDGRVELSRVESIDSGEFVAPSLLLREIDSGAGPWLLPRLSRISSRCPGGLGAMRSSRETVYGYENAPGCVARDA